LLSQNNAMQLDKNKPEKISNEEIVKIIELARWAPSGDNSQHWSFHWDGELLRVFVDKQRAEHILNPDDVCTYYAMGCLFEYIEAAALKYGYKAKLKYIDNDDLFAEYQFAECPADSGYIDSLCKRYTDRRYYKNKAVTENIINKCHNLAGKFEGIQLYFKTDKKYPEKFLDSFIKAEQFLWHKFKNLNFILQWMRLSKKEFQESSDGLSYGNLGINFIDALNLKLTRLYPFLYPLMRPFVLFKIAYNTKRYLREGAGLFTITVSDLTNNQQKIGVGRLGTQIWSYLNSEDISVQPMTSLVMQIYYFNQGNLAQAFDLNNIEYIQGAEDIFKKIYEIPSEEQLAWQFRFGYSEPVTKAMSIKRRDVDEMLNIS